MKNIVLTYGLRAGAILAATFLVTFPFHDAIGMEWGMVIGYTSMVVAFLLVFFGVRSYRDRVAGGTIGFWRALKVGALIAGVASACYVATWEVVYFGFAPDYIERYQASMLERERARGASEAELAAKREEMAKFAEMYANPVVNVAVTLLEPLPVALVMTLVTAGVLSRRRKGEGSGAGVVMAGANVHM